MTQSKLLELRPVLPKYRSHEQHQNDMLQQDDLRRSQGIKQNNAEQRVYAPQG